MIVLKDDDLPSVNEEFDALSNLQPENRLVWRTARERKLTGLPLGRRHRLRGL